MTILAKACPLLILLFVVSNSVLHGQPNAGFTVSGIPGAGAVSASATPIKICQGTKLTLHNTAFEIGGIINVVQYTTRTGSPATPPPEFSKFPDVQITFNTLGNDTIFQKVTDASGKTAKTFQPVLISDIFADSVFTYTSSNPAACGLGNFTFTARNKFGDAGDIYQWVFQGTSADSLTGSPVTIQFNNATGPGTGLYNATLVVLNQFGCTSTSTQKIAVGQLPDLTITSPNAVPPPTSVQNLFMLNTFTLCSGSDSVFKFANSSATAATNAYYHIVWGNGQKNFDSTSWSPANIQPETYPPGYDTLTITTTGTNTCTNTAKYLVYRGAPPPNDFLVNPHNTICTGDNVIIKFGPKNINGPAATAYTISIFENPEFDSSFSQGTVNATNGFFTHTFNQASCGVTDSLNPLVSNTYNVYFNETNACGALLTYPTAVNVSARPSVLINAPLNICNNSSAILSNTSNWTGVYPYCGTKPADGQQVWQITPPTGGSYRIINNNTGTLVPYVSGNDSITVSFNGVGTYRARLYIKSTNPAAASCVTADSANFADAYICVRNTPAPDFVLDGLTSCTGDYDVNVLNNIDTNLICGQNAYHWSVTAVDSAGYCRTRGKGQISDSTAALPSFSFPLPGFYKITLTVTPAGGYANACSKSVSHVVHIFAKPHLTLNSLPLICAGDSVRPAKYAVIDSCFVPGILQYTWFVHNVNDTTATSTDPGYITFPKGGTWYISLSLSSNYACGVVQATDTVKVNPLAVVNPIANTTICSGLPLNITPVSPDGIANFYWRSKVPGPNEITGNTSDTSGGGNAAISDTLVNISNPPANITVKYYVIATGRQCRSNVDSFKVTVLPANNADAGPDQYLCKGVTTTLLHATPPAVPGAVGTWSHGGPQAKIASLHDPNTMVSRLVPNTTYSFTWTVSNSGAFCADTLSTVNIVTDTIVNQISQPPLVCNSDTIHINSRLPAGPDSLSYTYQWLQSNDGVNFAPVASAFATQQNILIAPPPEKFYRRIVNFHSCTDTTKAVIVTFEPPLPKPTFTQTTQAGCGPLKVHFANTTPMPPYGQFNYQWFVDTALASNSGDSLNHTFRTTASGYTDTSYQVVLAASNGCTVLYDTTQVTAWGLPRAILVPDTTAGCSPLTVLFNNYSIGSNVTYIWNFGDGTGAKVINSATVPYVFHANVHTDFNITLQARNTCGADTASTDMSVNANAIILNFSMNGPSGFGCTGDTVVFKNNTTGANVFTWNFGGPQKDSNTLVTTDGQGTVNYIYQTPGADTVKLCAANSCTLDTCTSIIVNIKQTPIAAFTIAPTTVCTGALVTTANQSLPAGTPLAYRWSFGDASGVLSAKAPGHKYAVAGTDTVVLAASILYDQGFACSDSTFQIITVNGPSGQLSYSGTSCTGSNLTFQANSNNSINYLFDFNDNTPPVFSQTPFVTHAYAAPGVYLPKVTLNNAGCNTVITGADSLRVDYISAAYSYSYIPFCDSTTIVLKDSSYAFFGIAAYAWVVKGNSYTTNSVTATYLQTSNYPVSLTVTGTTGCTANIQSQALVYVHNTPAGNIAVNSSLCARDTAFFSAAFFSDDAQEFTWNFSNGDSKSGQNVSTVFPQPGFYNVRVIAQSSFGCADTVAQSITVNNTPFVQVSPGKDVWVCSGNSTSLSASGYNVASWNWGPTNGLSCFTCSNPQVTPAKTTLYTVAATSNDGCTGVDTVIVHVQQPFSISVTPLAVSVCLPDATLQPVQFFATGAENYTWLPATWLDSANIATPVLTIPQASVQTGGIVTYHVTGYDSHYCFMDTANIVVSVGLKPGINLGAGDSGVAGRTVVLQPLIETNGPFASFTWTVVSGDGTVTCLNGICDSVKFTINSDITFKLTAVNVFGCVTTDTIHYTAVCGPNSSQLYMPTAFSPDGDGINDVFMVQGKGIIVESFKIFNRWGQQVFDGGSNFAPNTPALGWNGTINGKPAQEDVYIYVAKVRCTAGNTSYFKKGSVTLIRVKN